MYSSYRKFEILYPYLILILLAIDFYNIFYHLGNFPISSWDEARHGVSAYEMLKQKNLVVSTYRYKIDYWNLKPPFSFWAVMAGYKLAGFNALGLRILSGISSMLTIIMVAAFVNKSYGKLAAILSTLALSTSTQFIINHSARTGDADALFVFLFTGSILSLLLSEQNDKWLYCSGIAFAFAFLTKSWHAGSIAIIIGLYVIITGKLKRLTKFNWILLISCMIIPILLWAVARYQYDGFAFFRKMIVYDLLQRSSTPIEGHIGGKLYYVLVLIRFFGLWLAILFGLAFLYTFKGLSTKILKSENKFYKLGICLWIIILFLLFTFAKTKIRWYILPVYTPLSIIIGVLASNLLMMQGRLRKKIMLILSILFVSSYYYGQIHAYLHRPIPNLPLSLLQQVHGLDEVKGSSIFLYRPTNPLPWQQNEVLTAELYGDLLVENGGLNDFLKKKRALLLVQKGLEAKQLFETNQLEILTSNKWGYIVRKREKDGITFEKNDKIRIEDRTFERVTQSFLKNR
ncbi:Undecaprenyl phosphate-alpha-4-amino-4-deoxy-L-arabinose arabinosyl transferase [Neobacillus rhizosphaerae]|uniref:Undecaprenyl phosphate-alpha-4-amino-4-deoxy-L-arabinose arabinosyl transferase n=1 Tax=Neobacillus rhizosphaerae TaxID=2880965 RepID=A0ABM9EPI2_9BACI|nr:glycosyltransferase family 39 protein [Neobacillus rhizosphaerae]CAH2714484.1 Undecaprenyl phosphate-alpha-4-amino-4-deoxy-L-arabinose arabinosyl transferase [Neobacillus rhizosphaerae]